MTEHDTGLTEEEREEQRQQGQSQDSSVIRDLREKAGKVPAIERERDEAQRKAQELERKLALRDQIDALDVPADKRGKFEKLASSMIDGEPDEAKLRELATEYGFLEPAPEVTAEGQRIETASSTHVGAKTPTPTEPEVLSKKIREANTEEEVLELARQAGVPIAGEG